MAMLRQVGARGLENIVFKVSPPVVRASKSIEIDVSPQVGEDSVSMATSTLQRCSSAQVVKAGL